MSVAFSAIADAVVARPMPSGPVTWNRVRGHERSQDVIEARTLIAVLALRHINDPSLPKVARLMNRDHSSVHHLVNVKYRDLQAKLEPLLKVIETELGVGSGLQPDDSFKTYSCEYPFEGGRWGFDIMARNFAEAEARRKAIAWGRVEGESTVRLPARAMTPRLANLLVGLINWWSGK